MTSAAADDELPCLVPLLDDAPEAAGAILASVSGPGRPAPSLYRALAHSPELLRAWVDFAWPLRALPTVPRGDRELAITYLGHRRNCRYVVVHHAKFAGRHGVDEQRLAALATDRPHDAAATPAQAAALRLVDSVVRAGAASADDIASLVRYYDRKGMVELLTTVAFYEMVCVVNRSLRIPVS